jgi:Spy/CpxP family protein refolding chaperone
MNIKILLTLVLAFVAVFGAGAMIGIARHTSGGKDPGHLRGDDSSRDGWLSRELNLTSEQREQMRAIWSQVMSADRGAKTWDERRAIQKQREQVVREMLGDEQKKEFDQINAEYDAKLAALGQAQRAAFEQATARTREILSPEQAAKYDEFLKRRGKGAGPRPFEKTPAIAPAAAQPSAGGADH